MRFFGPDILRFALAWMGLGMAESLRAEESEGLGRRFEFAMIQYEGGTWDISRAEESNHVTQLVPDFLRWLKTAQRINVAAHPLVLKLTDQRIFNCPILFINGHFRFKITDEEIANLREYLRRGGFLYVEDCGGNEQTFALHGRFAEQIREVLKAALPDGELRVLPPEHDIYRRPYSFPNGLPNLFGADNDQSPPDTPGKRRKGRGGEGFFRGEGMVAFLSDTDSCCGWGGVLLREDALKIGANVVVYAMTHSRL